MSPLPAGEGQGEGKRDRRTPRGHHHAVRLSTILLLLALLLGCTTRGKARRHAEAAYATGRAQALEEAQQRQRSVIILGDVRYPAIPWSEDLTLARALFAAEYTGATDPQWIVVKRDGEEVILHAESFLRGEEGDPPLLPGDIVELRR